MRNMQTTEFTRGWVRDDSRVPEAPCMDSELAPKPLASLTKDYGPLLQRGCYGMTTADDVAGE